MQTAIFWIAWGIISLWALRTFYYSFSAKKLKQLRNATVGFDIVVLCSFLFNFRPVSLGAQTGFELLLSGDWYIILLFVLLTLAVIFLLTKDRKQNKTGALLHIISSVYLFFVLAHLWPGTVTLSFVDSALPVDVLLLLTGNVSALLFWQQLQLLEKGKKWKKRR